MRSRADLVARGFSGFLSADALRSACSVAIPDQPGVYVVMRGDFVPPRFLRTSPAGWFRGKDPTLSLGELRSRWVGESQVLYVGKAGGKGGLRRRISTYLKHGAGAAAAHWGGRAVWQIATASELLFAWCLTPDCEPRHREKELLALFVSQVGRRPFANRTSYQNWLTGTCQRV